MSADAASPDAARPTLFHLQRPAPSMAKKPSSAALYARFVLRVAPVALVFTYGFFFTAPRLTLRALLPF